MQLIHLWHQVLLGGALPQHTSRILGKPVPHQSPPMSASPHKVGGIACLRRPISPTRNLCHPLRDYAHNHDPRPQYLRYLTRSTIHHPRSTTTIIEFADPRPQGHKHPGRLPWPWSLQKPAEHLKARLPLWNPRFPEKFSSDTGFHPSIFPSFPPPPRHTLAQNSGKYDYYFHTCKSLFHCLISTGFVHILRGRKPPLLVRALIDSEGPQQVLEAICNNSMYLHRFAIICNDWYWLTFLQSFALPAICCFSMLHKWVICEMNVQYANEGIICDTDVWNAVIDGVVAVECPHMGSCLYPERRVSHRPFRVYITPCKKTSPWKKRTYHTSLTFSIGIPGFGLVGWHPLLQLSPPCSHPCVCCQSFDWILTKCNVQAAASAADLQNLDRSPGTGIHKRMKIIWKWDDQEYDKNIFFGPGSESRAQKCDKNMKTILIKFENHANLANHIAFIFFSYYFDIIYTFWGPEPEPRPQSGGGPGPAWAPYRRFGAQAQVPGQNVKIIW